MGSVYKKTVTRPLPAGAELFTKAGEQFARWKPAKGRTRTAKVTTGKDGSPRILDESRTYIAKFRDGSGYVCEVSTGCRDEDAARSVLSKLERRAELVRGEVISTAEAATADHQTTPVAEHFVAYLLHQRSKVSERHLRDLDRIGNRMLRECGLKTLRDIRPEAVERWLVAQQAEGMAARTRNIHLQSVRGFCQWCVQTERLSSNPLARISKADENSDRRRQRRAMTEPELLKLLQVARLRPLAECGRETLAVDASDAEANGKRRKRSNWTYKPLTLDTLPAAVERARERLADNPDQLAELERLGAERALIYKTLVLTGLRRNELASLTVAQLDLTGPLPYAVLNAADEKSRQGSTIPIRTDLAAELREWIGEKRERFQGRPDAFGREPLFVVSDALVKILDRDLKAAGINKADERGRTIDVHALRTSFGTLLSKGGVTPRTAQAAMRHSNIDLTMNVYTDPKLLDVQGALDSLPSLDWKSPETLTERAVLRATGTDGRNPSVNPRLPATAGATEKSFVAPVVAPDTGERGQFLSFPVLAPSIGGQWEKHAEVSKFRSIDSESSDSYDPALSERLPVSVAQLDRASASEAEGWRFEPSREHFVLRLGLPGNEADFLHFTKADGFARSVARLSTGFDDRTGNDRNCPRSPASGANCERAFAPAESKRRGFAEVSRPSVRRSQDSPFGRGVGRLPIKRRQRVHFGSQQSENIEP